MSVFIVEMMLTILQQTWKNVENEDFMMTLHNRPDSACELNYILSMGAKEATTNQAVHKMLVCIVRFMFISIFFSFGFISMCHLPARHRWLTVALRRISS